MKLGALATLILLAAIAISGCAGGSKGAPVGSSSSAALITAGDDPEGGAIRGRVVDDEMLPVGRAKVGIVALRLETETDGEGSFAFSQIPAGRYVVAASALGYEQATAAVEVLAGETAQTTITLRAIKIEVPYNETLTYRGRMTLGFLYVPWSGIFDDLERNVDVPNPTNDRFAFNWTFKDNKYPTEEVFELVWTPAVATGTVLSMLYFVPDPDDPAGLDSHTILSKTGSSVLVGNVTSEQLEAAAKKYPKGSFIMGIYPDDTEVIANQDFTLYRTLFFHGPPPPGFSVLASKA